MSGTSALGVQACRHTIAWWCALLTFSTNTASEKEEMGEGVVVGGGVGAGQEGGKGGRRRRKGGRGGRGREEAGERKGEGEGRSRGEGDKKLIRRRGR